MMNRLDLQEANGDWRNFKGDYYHLLYALWLLIHEDKAKVAFYKGNDLLMQTPPLVTPDPKEPAIPMLLQSEDRETWIQLKSGAKEWTPTALIKEVLPNFINNGLKSRSHAKNYDVWLVTQGAIQTQPLDNFLSNFKNANPKKGLKKDFLAIVKRILKAWNDGYKSELNQQVDEAQTTEIALDILKKLSTQKPFDVEIMLLQIERKLMGVYFSEQQVENVVDRFIGALHRNTHLGPSYAGFFDEDWLERVAGRPLKLRNKFDVDPQGACYSANEEVFRSIQWEEDNYTSRIPLERAVKSFLESDATVFSIVGNSGIGKSWAAAWIATAFSADRLSLYTKAKDMKDYKDLPALVASRLQGMTMAENKDEVLLRRYTDMSVGKFGNNPILVIDDLTNFSNDLSEIRRQIARLASQAKEYGIKLILTAQTQTWRYGKIWQILDEYDVYPLSASHDDPISMPLREIDDLENETRNDSQDNNLAGQGKNQKERWQKSSLPNERISFVLEEFSVDELEDAAKRRLKGMSEKQVNAIAKQLRLPLYVVLRNPFFFDSYLKDVHPQTDATLPLPDIDVLLDKRISDSFEVIEEKWGKYNDDLRSYFNQFVSNLWDVRVAGMEAARARNLLNDISGLLGDEFLKHLQDVTLVTTGTVTLTRTPVSERLFALELQKRADSGEDIVKQLRLDEDGGNVVAYIRHLSQKPLTLDIKSDAPSKYRDKDAVTFAEKLLGNDKRWVRPICDGLSQAPPDDIRVIAFLGALAQPQEGVVSHRACISLARLAARGSREKREALQWITSLYMSDDIQDQWIGSNALRELFEYSAERVARIVCRRLEKAARIDYFHSTDRKKRDAVLRYCLDPIQYPRHIEAAQAVQQISDSYRHLINHYGLNRYSIGEDYIDQHLAENFAEARGGQIV